MKPSFGQWTSKDASSSPSLWRSFSVIPWANIPSHFPDSGMFCIGFAREAPSLPGTFTELFEFDANARHFSAILGNKNCLQNINNKRQAHSSEASQSCIYVVHSQQSRSREKTWSYNRSSRICDMNSLAAGMLLARSRS